MEHLGQRSLPFRSDHTVLSQVPAVVSSRPAQELWSHDRLTVELRQLLVVFQTMDDLVVEDVEAHRSERQAGHDVHGTEPDGPGRSVVLLGGSGSQVAETYCAEAHEAEVNSVDRAPAFKLVQNHCAEKYVSENCTEAEAHWSENGETPERHFRVCVCAA